MITAAFLALMISAQNQAAVGNYYLFQVNIVNGVTVLATFNDEKSCARAKETLFAARKDLGMGSTNKFSLVCVESGLRRP